VHALSAALGLALALSGTAGRAEQELRRLAAQDAPGPWELRVPAPELENTQGSPAELRAVIYRSPGWARRGPDQPAWLALYLPGFDGDPATLGPALEKVEVPLLLVAVDGRTGLGGTWYADSPASGRWESAVLEALLPAARAALAPEVGPERTLIVGHSMGGYGALRLALDRPGSFRGAGLLNPALRPQALAELARAQKARAGPGPPGFWERLLQTTQATFAPKGSYAELKARLAELDLTRTPPRALAGLDRLFAATGEEDLVCPPADLKALDTSCLDPRSAHLAAHPGGHTEHLQQDLGEALRFLTAPGPRRAGRCPSR
jgi:pimeloyl-ACP methyl ester carboxylesterase